jgi:hypothetical protein
VAPPQPVACLQAGCGDRRAVGLAAAQQDGQAVRADADADRLAVEKDLIEAQGVGAGAAQAIQGVEHATGLACGTGDPAADGGAVGAVGPQDDGEQLLGLVVAESPGGGGEAVLAVGVQGGRVRAAAQAVEFTAEALVVQQELLAVRPRGLGGGDEAEDAVGLFVSGLAGATSPLGLRGDGAVGAGEDGGGVADPSEGG